MGLFKSVFALKNENNPNVSEASKLYPDKEIPNINQAISSHRTTGVDCNIFLISSTLSTVPAGIPEQDAMPVHQCCSMPT